MAELWLPIDRLTATSISSVSCGRLVVLTDTGRQPRPPAIGIRFNAPDRLMALALTAFYNGRYPPGDAVDLSSETRPALSLNAGLSIEADLGSPAMSSGQDFHRGDLIETDEGMGVAAYFGRHNPGVMDGIGIVLTSTWEHTPRAREIRAFGRWRLRIDIEHFKPIYFSPSFESET